MNPTSPDDLALARAGDVAAFLRLVQPFDRELRGFAYRMLGERSAMDDVLQDVYLSAFRSIGRFRGEASLRTWLYRITRNRCVDVLRSRRFNLEVGEFEGQAPSFEDEAVRRLDLVAALSRLSPDHRAVVLLVDSSGLDYRSTAAVLGVRVGTVRSRLARARAQLRSFLEDHDG